MIRACLGVLAGVYALQLSSFPADSDPSAIALVAFIAAIWCWRWRLLVGFCAGLGAFAVAAGQVIESRVSSEFVGDSIVAVVRIADFPETSGRAVAFTAMAQARDRIPRRLRLSWFEPPVALRMGDVWQFELRLRRPRGNLNPGGFDYEAWLLQRRTGAVGYVVDGRRNHLLRAGQLGPIDRLRQRCVSRLVETVDDAEAAAVLVAITVGARHLISREQWDRYARTGTSHLMAISGLHIGLAAAGGYVLASVFAGLFLRRGNLHELATVTALLLAILYALVSGLAIPAQRATVMIALVAIVVLWRRQVAPAAILAAACLAVLVKDPLTSMAPGFKLSFAAVSLLIWLARQRFRNTEPHWWARPLIALRQLGAVQIVLLLGLLPLTALIFNRVAFVAPLVNFITVPVFSLVTVPASLIGLLLDGALRLPGDSLLALASASLGVIHGVIEQSAALPGAAFESPDVSGIAWLIIAMPLVRVLTPPGWPVRSVSWVALCALVLYEPGRPPAACVDLTVLDVGQGLAVVAVTKSHVAVFDAGPMYRGGRSAADTVVLPYLSGSAIRHVDRLIVSHADLDHSGGVAALQEEVDIGELVVGEPLTSIGTEGHLCVAGETWVWDQVSFRFIHPSDASPRDGNNASCVLVVETGPHRIVLTGDIERPAEAAMVAAGLVPAADIVLVPHHGSNTSSALPFVAALRPAFAIVSASYGNRWGFPTEDVVERWSSNDARVVNTAVSGAISVRMCAPDGVVVVREERRAQRRIWHE